jgi:hypothetical protein
MERYLFDLIPAGEGTFYLKNKEHERCVAPNGGSAGKDGINLVFQEQCGGDSQKFVLEPKKDALDKQFTTVSIDSDKENWEIKGRNTEFSAKVDTPPEARQIKSHEKTSAGCMEFRPMFKGSRRRRRNSKPNPPSNEEQRIVAKGCQDGGGLKGQGFVYDRLSGGTLRDQSGPGALCLTRTGKTVSMKKCDGGKGQAQQWKRMCGAWANGEGHDGRVLTLTKSKSGNKKLIAASKWKGEKNQLWHYKEVVKHSECTNKRFKLMTFDGTTNGAVTRRNFIGMPSERVTVTMWLRGTGTLGTAFSYATKNKLASFSMEFTTMGSVVHVRDVKVLVPKVKLTQDKWSHIAVTWDNRAGDLGIYQNNELKFHKRGVAKGEEITAGGCLVVGQKQKQMCSGFVESKSFSGEITDFQVWKGVLNPSAISDVMQQPVPQPVIDQAGEVETPLSHKNLRLSWLARQYAEQELSKPTCDLDQYKEKTLKGPEGFMSWAGSGDVHYNNFQGCKYDDQSVGEWTAVQVDKKYWDTAPLIIQFRTSPQRTSCDWCQNGAVSYIDGCAIKYKDDQASAGFGGYSDPYNPYAAVNGKEMNNWADWHETEEFKVKADGSRFKAVLNDGSELICQRQSISLSLSRKFEGKVHGIAGAGLPRKGEDWKCGPNSDACPECKAGEELPGMKDQCPPQYVYGDANHPLNGNRATKPLVRWFQSWQVDGNHIPSAFYYKDGEHAAGSFNRKNGEKIKPPSGTNKQPKAKFDAASHACKDFRESPKMRKKCIFDFLILGKTALKDSKKDRINQRMANKRIVTSRSVRDISRYKNDGEWTSHINWGCAGDFLKQQGSSIERFGAQQKAGKAGKATIEEGQPIDIPRGQWVETRRVFDLPIDMEADLKASAPGSIFVSMLNSEGKLLVDLPWRLGSLRKGWTPRSTSQRGSHRHSSWQRTRNGTQFASKQTVMETFSIS